MEYLLRSFALLLSSIIRLIVSNQQNRQIIKLWVDDEFHDVLETYFFWWNIEAQFDRFKTHHLLLGSFQSALPKTGSPAIAVRSSSKMMNHYDFPCFLRGWPGYRPYRFCVNRSPICTPTECATEDSHSEVPRSVRRLALVKRLPNGHNISDTTLVDTTSSTRQK